MFFEYKMLPYYTLSCTNKAEETFFPFQFDMLTLWLLLDIFICVENPGF